jgi:DNA end-binding protein Ku
MLYMLRYEEELRDSKSALSGVKEASVGADELSLAKQLINGSTSKFDLSAYKNDYEAAVKKLVDAKRKGKPLPEPEPEPAKTKVVNILDALRSSLTQDKKHTKAIKKPARRKKAA